MYLADLTAYTRKLIVGARGYDNLVEDKTSTLSLGTRMQLLGTALRNHSSDDCILTSSNSNGWVSKAFLDVLREHILPNLKRFYANQSASGFEVQAHTPMPVSSLMAWQGARERRLESQATRQAHASIALVCCDWASAQRQAETEVLQVNTRVAVHAANSDVLEYSVRKRTLTDIVDAWPYLNQRGFAMDVLYD